MIPLIALLLAAGDPAADFESLRSTPLAQGRWIYQPIAGGSVARFSPYVSVRCDRASGRVQLVAPGYTKVATDTAAVTLPPGGWFAARDRRLDAIIFSRSRVVLTGGEGRPPVAVPAEPEAARSIEDCRN